MNGTSPAVNSVPDTSTTPVVVGATVAVGPVVDGATVIVVGAAGLPDRPSPAGSVPHPTTTKLTTVTARPWRKARRPEVIPWWVARTVGLTRSR